ncbi:acyclic terpene utilization AtuA family protein [Variovorax sp. DT-64]|uniref:acyclic terpene utilization AtuA family protein n=1 Tax=Variovorax sp. DT-64 TaxID=3396160 RepID=UPI003F19C892
MKAAVKILVPSGAIGAGGTRSPEPFERGVRECPDVIAVDGGSTDSGPYYLGSGEPKPPRGALRAELRQLMIARAALGVPLIVGSCGTSGSDNGVNVMHALCEDIARELGQTVRTACIYSEQPAQTIRAALHEGRISALQPERPISEALINRCSRIVAAMGVEPIIHALRQGVDIVLAGRATDTALMAAVPIMRGMAAGASWHAGKILECGAMCTTKPASGAVLATVDDTGFTIHALAEGGRATPRTVLAHMLYENSNPYVLIEPGGVLDVSAASYSAVDERSVRVEGSTWTPSSRYTVKLEGAAPVGYQGVILNTLRSPRYKRRFDEWIASLESRVRSAIASQLGLEEEDYHLQFRAIGRNATLGEMETAIGEPVEIGVMGIVTSPSHACTKELLSMLNSPMLHFPLSDDEELPTHAFPFSPATMDRGLVYEFVLNHVMTVDDPLSPFRFNYATCGVAP